MSSAGKCTCGGLKARTGHSDWCDINTPAVDEKEARFSKFAKAMEEYDDGDPWFTTFDPVDYSKYLLRDDDESGTIDEEDTDDYVDPAWD